MRSSAHKAHTKKPTLYSKPSSKKEGSPSAACSGLGTATPVPPLYATSSGSDAKSGSTSLTRQRTSSTSSAKPRKTMKQFEASAAL